EGGQSVSIMGDNSGGYYWLRYTGRHWEIYNYATSGYVDNNSVARRASASWGTSDQTEISAAYNFNLVQTYYYNIHSRNSYDGSGVKALANVHVSGDTDNASWDPNTQQFYFYPGSYFGELTVLDVCAHEFTHAVTEKTADLVYQNEPGALNESFSDVFGAIIEFANQPDGRASYPARTAGYADWLIGEDCTYPYDVALRDMRNPRRYSNPSKYHGTDWYYGSDDNGGVHYNNGVQNHFFYLLCEGGSGNNDSISYNITGIGVENARLIAYRALTVYCTRNTDYAAVRTAWISAAQDLNSSWVSSVQTAWAAVGVDDTGVTTTKVGPAIKANGVTNNITVNYPDTVSVTVEMNADIYAGVDVDWWVVALAGSSWFYMDSAAGWTQEGAWRPVYQGALGNLPATKVLDMAGLQIGSYTFWFAVDYPMDGVLTEDAIWFDSVNVTVQ
ncbi:MAG: M4 family metallopeptidase, partial [Verrucomicrobiota bacterium]